MIKLLFLTLCCVVLFPNTARPSDRVVVIPVHLTCESQEHPLGIDVFKPRFGWTLSLKKADARDVVQAAYRVLVASSQRSLDADVGDMWDSGKVVSASQFDVEYAGKAQRSNARYYWKVRVSDGRGGAAWSGSSSYSTALLYPWAWRARWISSVPDTARIPGKDHGWAWKNSPQSLPIFRREFVTHRRPTLAMLFVSGLGQYEVHVNGRKVTDAVLTPGWTNYASQVPYNAYDVTHLLRKGSNALGILLGNGMYNVEGTRGRYTKFVGSFGQPKVILQLHLRFNDGSERDILSDSRWKSAAGPIVFSSTYGGEDYDARRELPGWDIDGFDDRTWPLAHEVSGPGGKLVSERSPQIKVIQTFRPIFMRRPVSGVVVYDLGQNFAGWPVIAVSGPRGASVKLITGELLDAAGLVTQRSAGGSAKSENSFTYTLRGGGIEYWHPRFSYYGFRYVQVEHSGIKHAIVHGVTGQAIHSVAAVSGNFTSSDKVLEKIHHLILAAIQSNMVSVLTDCPHREKLGWLEQTHLAAASIMYNYDVSRLYNKMSADIQQAQLESGMVPGIAPEYVAFVDSDGKDTEYRDSPEWGSASILSAWAAYQFYGNLGNLRDHYESMKRYVAYLRGRTSKGVLEYGLGDWYDVGPDGPGASQLTSNGLTATAIYYQDLRALSQIASLLNKPQDSVRYAAESTKLKAIFNARFFHEGVNEYDRGSQTAEAMPLALGLVPPGHEERVLQSLVNDIRKRGNHVTAGDIGFHSVVRALTDTGRSDVLYDMLSRTDAPSYGYQLARGATALTEDWNAAPDSSQNHFMLGHAEEWFYRGLAGIAFDLSRPLNERIRIEPFPVHGVRLVSSSFESVLGRIESDWRREGNTLKMKVIVPPGATATVYFPRHYSVIGLDGLALAVTNGIHSIRRDGDSVTCVIGSGTYHFDLSP